MNPITSLVEFIDGMFADYASPKVRRIFHAVLTLAFLVVSVWLASDGNWIEMVLALLAAGYTQANKANTPPTDEPLDGGHTLHEVVGQPVHVDDIVPRTAEHDRSELYGDGADRGESREG